MTLFPWLKSVVPTFMWCLIGIVWIFWKCLCFVVRMDKESFVWQAFSLLFFYTSGETFFSVESESVAMVSITPIAPLRKWSLNEQVSSTVPLGQLANKKREKKKKHFSSALYFFGFSLLWNIFIHSQMMPIRPFRVILFGFFGRCIRPLEITTKKKKKPF